MSEKFMKHKKIVITAFLLAMTLSQLVGCSSTSKSNLAEMLSGNETIEVIVNVPESAVVCGNEQELTVTQLDQLKSYDKELRVDMDSLFHINIVSETSEDGEAINGKSGCMYVSKGTDGEDVRNGNSYLSNALRNKVFMEKYMKDSTVTTSLSEYASNLYADVDKEDSLAVYAALNAYFNLFAEDKDVESKEVYFNAVEPLTRGEFYSFMYRANNGVEDLEHSKVFDEAVSDVSKDALYASQSEGYAWLTTSNKGLNKSTYEGTMTQGEAIYMLMRTYFGEELAKVSDEDIKKASFSDAKNGGDLTDKKEKLYTVNKETKEHELVAGWELGVIKIMQDGSAGENLVDENIYKALVLAQEKGIIGNESKFNSAINKSSAIDLVVKANKALNKTSYLTTAEYGKMGTNVKSSEELVGIEEELSEAEKKAKAQNESIAKQQSVNNPEEGYASREAAYNKAGLTENQKKAAENYIKESGLSVADAIAKTKEKVPETKPAKKPAPKPAATPAPKPAATPAPKTNTSKDTPSTTGSDTMYDSEGFPTTGAFSKAGLEAGGMDTDAMEVAGSEGCYSSGTVEGDQGFN